MVGETSYEGSPYSNQTLRRVYRVTMTNLHASGYLVSRAEYRFVLGSA